MATKTKTRAKTVKPFAGQRDQKVALTPETKVDPCTGLPIIEGKFERPTGQAGCGARPASSGGQQGCGANSCGH